MPTFIDESGDPGRIPRGSPFFVLTAVWVPTHADAERSRAAIRNLRKVIGLRQNYEFKYSKSHGNPVIRAAFFAEALTTPFRFACHSIKKTDQYERLDIYWECATILAVSLRLRPLYCAMETKRSETLREPIVVDDNRDPEFLALVKKQFRGRPGSSLIGNVSFRNSAADEMLQLADMVCGAVADSDRSWFEWIAERDVTL